MTIVTLTHREHTKQQSARAHKLIYDLTGVAVAEIVKRGKANSTYDFRVAAADGIRIVTFPNTQSLRRQANFIDRMYEAGVPCRRVPEPLWELVLRAFLVIWREVEPKGGEGK